MNQGSNIKTCEDKMLEVNVNIYQTKFWYFFLLKSLINCFANFKDFDTISMRLDVE